MDADTGTNAVFFKHEFRRPVDKIAFVRGEFSGIGCDGDGRFCLPESQLVINVDILHDHSDLVVTVRQPSHHVKTQIDFCKSL